MGDAPRGTGKAGFETASTAGDQLGFWGPMIQSVGQGWAQSGDLLGDVLGLGTAGNHMGGMGSVLGLGTGLYNMFAGDTMTDRVMGGANALTGGIGTAGWIGSMMGAETGIMGGLASAGGALGLNAPAFAGATWGAGAASGGAALGTGLATGGAVLGAGLAGYGIGSYGNEMSAKYGVFGRGDDGKNRTASDWAADAGGSADSFFDDLTGNDTIGDIAGGITTIGASVVGAVPAIGSAILGAGSAALSFIGGIFSW